MLNLINKYKGITVLNYFTLSDLHLGHHNVKTDEIIDQLMLWFKENYKTIHVCDLLVINGDVYDKLIMSGSEEDIKISAWLIWLFNWCVANDVYLVIVKGTDSHDMNQISVFDLHIKENKHASNFKYVTDINIISFKGKNILFIPDNQGTGDAVYEVVKGLLQKNNLVEVDIMFVHGQFHFQLPNIILESSHDEERYLAIVKHYIHVGHIHMFKTYDRIIGNGSFPRLQHGEESPKGGVVAYVGGISDRYIFLENTKANIFATITVTQETLSEAISYVKKELRKYKHGDNIKLKFKNETIARHNLEFKEILTGFKYKLESKIKEEKIPGELEYPVIEITPNNIHDELLIQTCLHNKGISLTSTQMKIYKEELDMLVNAY